MKVCTSIVLFIFILFLSAPTLVTMIEKETDISMFYSFAEEEHHKEAKVEVKNYFENNSMDFFDKEEKYSFFSKDSEHPTVFREIFSPPPNCL